jgi:uncharacterized damage-inducible protein DinB
VDVLDRLLGHDSWTTAQLLSISRGLTDEQLDRPFDIGHVTLRETFEHMIGNVEVWTDLLAERTADETPKDRSLDSLLARHERSYAEFATLARRLQDDQRLDDTFVDTLDNPPRRKPFGGTIVHVITHNMFHRADLLHILHRLGVPNLPEGDALSWENSLGVIP